jgi:hypothetical protein
MAPSRPLPGSVLVVCLLISAYVVAFLHGRLSHTRAACGSCAPASADDDRVKRLGGLHSQRPRSAQAGMPAVGVPRSLSSRCNPGRVGKCSAIPAGACPPREGTGPRLAHHMLCVCRTESLRVSAGARRRRGAGDDDTAGGAEGSAVPASHHGGEQSAALAARRLHRRDSGVTARAAAVPRGSPGGIDSRQWRGGRHGGGRGYGG